MIGDDVDVLNVKILYDDYNIVAVDDDFVDGVNAVVALDVAIAANGLIMMATIMMIMIILSWTRTTMVIFMLFLSLLWLQRLLLMMMMMRLLE